MCGDGSDDDVEGERTQGNNNNNKIVTCLPMPTVAERRFSNTNGSGPGTPRTLDTTLNLPFFLPPLCPIPAVTSLHAWKPHSDPRKKLKNVPQPYHIYRYTYNNNILLGLVPGEEFFSLSRITTRGRYEHLPTPSLGTRYKKLTSPRHTEARAWLIMWLKRDNFQFAPTTIHVIFILLHIIRICILYRARSVDVSIIPTASRASSAVYIVLYLLRHHNIVLHWLYYII